MVFSTASFFQSCKFLAILEKTQSDFVFSEIEEGAWHRGIPGNSDGGIRLYKIVRKSAESAIFFKIPLVYAQFLVF